MHGKEKSGQHRGAPRNAGRNQQGDQQHAVERMDRGIDDVVAERVAAEERLFERVDQQHHGRVIHAVDRRISEGVENRDQVFTVERIQVGMLHDQREVVVDECAAKCGLEHRERNRRERGPEQHRMDERKPIEPHRIARSLRRIHARLRRHGVHSNGLPHRRSPAGLEPETGVRRLLNRNPIQRGVPTGGLGRESHSLEFDQANWGPASEAQVKSVKVCPGTQLSRPSPPRIHFSSRRKSAGSRALSKGNVAWGR
jgi:hypothetical protein